VCTLYGVRKDNDDGVRQESLLRVGSTPRSPYSSLTLRSASVLSPFNANSSMSPGSVNSLFFSSTSLLAGGVDSPLANSPHLPSCQAFQLIHRPTSLAEKARINSGWFDSSRSLMEQGVTENSVMQLRYKFYAFYNINQKVWATLPLYIYALELHVY